MIDNYKENRLIYEELNHYKTHHSILGKHPVFECFKRVQQLSNMNVAELFKLKLNVANKLGKAQRSLADEPHHPKTDDRLHRITMLEKELKQISHLLNL